MPKYRVIQYFTASVGYVVEAANEDDAIDLVNGPKAPKPEFSTGNEFSDEIVEEIDTD